MYNMSQMWNYVLLSDTQSLITRRPHHDPRINSAWKAKTVILLAHAGKRICFMTIIYVLVIIIIIVNITFTIT